MYYKFLCLNNKFIKYFQPAWYKFWNHVSEITRKGDFWWYFVLNLLLATHSSLLPATIYPRIGRKLWEIMQFHPRNSSEDGPSWPLYVLCLYLASEKMLLWFLTVPHTGRNHSSKTGQLQIISLNWNPWGSAHGSSRKLSYTHIIHYPPMYERSLASQSDVVLLRMKKWEKLYPYSLPRSCSLWVAPLLRRTRWITT